MCFMYIFFLCFFFFFSSRRRHTRCGRDWSSDVCSSDLIAEKYANENNIDIIVNGDSLGQVASQTLASLKVVENVTNIPIIRRSEERRVGKECRSRWSPDQ